MPAPVPEKHEHGKARQSEKAEAIKIELTKARGGLQVSEQERRRENQRLRIGDLGRSSEHIMRPKRRLTRVKGICQKLKLRLKMRLGVIRDGYGAAQPWGREQNPTNRKRYERRVVTRFMFSCHVLQADPPMSAILFYPATAIHNITIEEKRRSLDATKSSGHWGAQATSSL